MDQGQIVCGKRLRTTTLKIIITLMIIGRSIAEDACPAPFEHRAADCSVHGDDVGKRLMCLGDQYMNSKISPRKLEMALFTVMEDIPAHAVYTSIGIITGHSTRLAMGRQTHFRFDSVASMRLNPNSYYSHMVYYTHTEESTRPTILYTNTPMTLTPFPDTPIRMNVISGEGNVKMVYDISAAALNAIGTNEACNAFIAWKQLNDFRDYPRIAIRMPTKYYCKSAISSFDIVIGEYTLDKDEKSSFDEVFLDPIWERTKQGSYGEVPRDVPDF